MESHKFIVVPLYKMAKIEQKRHGDVLDHHKVDGYIIGGGGGGSFIFTPFFVRLNSKDKFYIVRIQLFWKGRDSKYDKK